MDYQLENTCGICSNETTMCPIKYKCGHNFCMKCVYSNRHYACMKKCPLCRTDDTEICTINSPIFFLHTDINYEEFYTNFIGALPIETNTSEILNKIVIITRSKYIAEKEININISLIGKCTEYNNDQQKITFTECYYLDRNTGKFYPTYPDTYIHYLDESDKIYTV